MRTSVLDFIDSATLRQHLTGQQLAPAIECILISQCRSKSLEDKLDALQERCEAYTSEDFRKGRYNCKCGEFRNALARYIMINRAMLENISPHMKSCIASSDPAEDGTELYDKDYSVFEINRKREVTFIYPIDSDYLEWDISASYAEIPHKYKVGDIVRYGERYYVISSVKCNDKVMPYYNDTNESIAAVGFEIIERCPKKNGFVVRNLQLLEIEGASDRELKGGEQSVLRMVSAVYRGKMSVEDLLVELNDVGFGQCYMEATI